MSPFSAERVNVIHVDQSEEGASRCAVAECVAAPPCREPGPIILGADRQSEVRASSNNGEVEATFDEVAGRVHERSGLLVVLQLVEQHE